MVTELKKGVYWVGVVDWGLRHFHGHEQESGVRMKRQFSFFLSRQGRKATGDRLQAREEGRRLQATRCRL